MRQEVAEKLVEALESKRYKEQKGWSRALCQGEEYTILGVLSELAVDEGLMTAQIVDPNEYESFFDIKSRGWISYSSTLKGYKPASSSRTDDTQFFLLSPTVKNWAEFDGIIQNPQPSFQEYADLLKDKYIKPKPKGWEFGLSAMVILGPLLVSAIYLLSVW